MMKDEIINDIDALKKELEIEGLNYICESTEIDDEDNNKIWYFGIILSNKLSSFIDADFCLPAPISEIQKQIKKYKQKIDFNFDELFYKRLLKLFSDVTSKEQNKLLQKLEEIQKL